MHAYTYIMHPLVYYPVYPCVDMDSGHNVHVVNARILFDLFDYSSLSCGLEVLGYPSLENRMYFCRKEVGGL